MSRLATVALVLLSCTFTLSAQAGPPDVIVGDLIDIDNYGTVGGISAFAVGTESCNIGNTNLTWNANTNDHPVIAQNMYRMKDGRFEQIGMSWLKHGFYALSLTLCGSCPIASGGDYLNVGCSDPYTASLNGNQGNGPRSEVNPVTGYFPYPPGTFPVAAPTIGRRIQVPVEKLNPATNAGALYFAEGHYIHPEDAASGPAIRNNNASYRQFFVNPATGFVNWSYPMGPPAQPTQQQKPAIQAWQDYDPTVQIHYVDVPGDGRIIVAMKATPVSGSTYHYEYAVQNLNSDRAVGGFSVEMWPGANPTNIGSQAIDHHSGEPYATADWTPLHTPGQLFPGSLTWSTQPHAVNPNANALRWGSLFNFWFDCDQLPGNASFTMFKPGSPTTVAVPAFCPPQRPPPGPPAPYVLQTAVSYDWVSFSTGSSSLGPVGDDNSFTVNIPFSFPFYGQNYTQVVISTNGYLALPGNNGNLHSNGSLPDAAAPNGIIAGYWDDLNCPSVGNIRYKTIGTSPAQRFVVYWNCVHSGDTGALQFQVILDEDGTITNSIQACPATFAGVGCTRGIENHLNTEGLMYSYNSPSSALPLTTIKYVINNGVPISSNLFHSGSLGGGMFRVTYVSAPGNPVISFVGVDPTPTYLGVYGQLDMNIFNAIALFDYTGIFSGIPNPGAITAAPCGSVEGVMWVNPGAIPSGIVIYHQGVDVPANPLDAPNNWFHISNLDPIVVP